jgi:hypothetical protein
MDDDSAPWGCVLRTRIKELQERAITQNHPNDWARIYSLRISPPTPEALDRHHYYKFKSGPSQRDPVLDTIIKAIQTLEKRRMWIANARLRVMPSNAGPPIWPPEASRKQHPIKLYTFQLGIEEFPVTVAIKIVPREHPLTAEKLRVKVGVQWVDFNTWIHTLAPVFKDSDEAYEAQRYWWKVNGKSFRLMDLPTELRLVIFEFALAPGRKIYPMSADHAYLMQNSYGHESLVWGREKSIVLGRGHPQVYRWSGPITDSELHEPYPEWRDEDLDDIYSRYFRPEIIYDSEEPNLSLLQVSKRVYAEALQAGWENTRKCFAESRVFSTVLATRDLCPVPMPNWLNRLQLCFTNDDFLWFFGVNVPSDTGQRIWRHGPGWQDAGGRLIMSLSTLKDLQLKFRRITHRGYGTPFNRHENGWLPCHEVCQRTIVDGIMALATPWIKHIDKVTLIGDVRTCTKKKWEGILYAEHHGQPHEFDCSQVIDDMMRAIAADR